MHAGVGASYQYMLTVAHCTAWADNQSIYNGAGAYVVDVCNPNHNILCRGDSGGPIYYCITGYPNSVIAPGLVEGIYSNGPGCSNLGAISGVSTAIDTVGQGLTITLG